MALTSCASTKPAPQTEAQTPAEDPKPSFKPSAEPAPKIDAARAMQYVREQVAFGPRWPSSPGHKKIQDYLRSKLKRDGLEEDRFTASTPVGKFDLCNFIAKFPGTTDQIIVLASHYETPYHLKDIKFVGANDGGSSTALLLEIANQLRGKKRTGPAIWLVFFDGEEAFKQWSETDSLYGSRHLAEKWKQDGAAKRIRAFILADMIGDADLNIELETKSPPWLRDITRQAAADLNVSAHFFGRETSIEDDHVPFARIGVPVIDLIDLDYGFNNVFHHSADDTLDKLSPRSLEIVGNVILEMVRRLSGD
ncbi:MAG: M28 family peptidase [Acidobacteriales bacterium]|nr:M28 family peptidase [Terriglobales bacterium]